MKENQNRTARADLAEHALHLYANAVAISRAMSAWRPVMAAVLSRDAEGAADLLAQLDDVITALQYAQRLAGRMEE